MYFNICRMGCRELRHDIHAVSLLTDHTIFSRNGALKVWGRHPASMVLCRGWGRCGEIHTESGGCEASPKTNRMQKRYVLKSGVW